MHLAADNLHLAADNSHLAADNSHLAADNFLLEADISYIAADISHLAADSSHLAAVNFHLAADNFHLAHCHRLHETSTSVYESNHRTGGKRICKLRHRHHILYCRIQMKVEKLSMNSSFFA